MVFAPWSVVAAVAAASAILIRPLWAVLPVWLALVLLARVLGASGSYGKALRRLAIPAGIVVIAAWLGWLLPPLAGAALVAVSLPVAGFEARLARFHRAAALGLPLLVLAAALVWSR